jgi:hypothetical protein
MPAQHALAKLSQWVSVRDGKLHADLSGDSSTADDVFLLLGVPVSNLSVRFCNKTLWCVVASFPSISLTVGNCDDVTDSDLANNISTMANITELSLTGCNNLSDEGLRHINRMSARLTRLDISRCKKITHIGVLHVGRLNLTELNFSSTNVCDRGLAHITGASSSSSLAGVVSTPALLTRLDISRCKYITDAGMEYVGRLSNLTELDVSRNHVGNRGLAFISSLARSPHAAQHPPLLRYHRRRHAARRPLVELDGPGHHLHTCHRRLASFHP